MARFKAPIARAVDTAFLRAAIVKLQEARMLRRFADTHVTEIRQDILKRVDKALWTRYKVYHKNDEHPPLFLDWVLGCKTLHDTYKKHGRPTRLYWVYRIIQSARMPELALFDELSSIYGLWYHIGLENLINKRRTTENFWLTLFLDETTDQYIEGSVPIIGFGRADLRPEVLQAT